ncbi:unnamed protein product [Oikopleura dioica]|uniref:Mitochondrial import inner membrane translocase subunit n=1 Tax=Oikopleura dioica TaxID=34765 RepID=E4X9G6_OIKDI|nr:unnamed protein product [Oikopleura dioica]
MGWFGSSGPEQKKKNYDESMDDGAAGGGYDKYDSGSSAGMAPSPLGGGLGMSEDLGAASMPGNISQAMGMVKQQLKQQLAQAHQQALMEAINKNCLDACDPDGSSRLQTKCVETCAARYIDAWNHVSKSVRNAQS